MPAPEPHATPTPRPRTCPPSRRSSARAPDTPARPPAERHAIDRAAAARHAAGAEARAGRAAARPAALPMPSLSRRRVVTAAGVLVGQPARDQLRCARSARRRPRPIAPPSCGPRTPRSQTRSRGSSRTSTHVQDPRFIQLAGRAFGLGGPRRGPVRPRRRAPPRCRRRAGLGVGPARRRAARSTARWTPGSRSCSGAASPPASRLPLARRPPRRILDLRQRAPSARVHGRASGGGEHPRLRGGGRARADDHHSDRGPRVRPRRARRRRAAPGDRPPRRHPRRHPRRAAHRLLDRRRLAHAAAARVHRDVRRRRHLRDAGPGPPRRPGGARRRRVRPRRVRRRVLPLPRAAAAPRAADRSRSATSSAGPARSASTIPAGRLGTVYVRAEGQNHEITATAAEEIPQRHRRQGRRRRRAWASSSSA